jgi:hypothetical protein
MRAQQASPADTTHAPPQTTAQTDSTAKNAQTKQESSGHSKKVLWWVGGAAVYVLLMVLLSDHRSSY